VGTVASRQRPLGSVAGTDADSDTSDPSPVRRARQGVLDVGALPVVQGLVQSGREALLKRDHARLSLEPSVQPRGHTVRYVLDPS
jgi:hypothetical protein